MITTCCLQFSFLVIFDRCNSCTTLDMAEQQIQNSDVAERTVKECDFVEQHLEESCMVEHEVKGSFMVGQQDACPVFVEHLVNDCGIEDQQDKHDGSVEQLVENCDLTRHETAGCGMVDHANPERQTWLPCQPMKIKPERLSLVNRRLEEYRALQPSLSKVIHPPTIYNESAARYRWRIIRQSLRCAIDLVNASNARDIVITHGVHHKRQLSHSRFIDQVLYNKNTKVSLLNKIILHLKIRIL